MGGREEFLQIWQQHVTRPGSEKLPFPQGS